ncbi:hypothetical protein Ga0123462_2061 [Mariprofundus ferrinatatus]|uniref:Uncharacterized protein n=1 Tax=Mariprofundus ferrinatatus TaxID=1921087 RepID=A0A2K8LF53_9PROT|nr:hypothetical protein Ga0123462_2061 [Mariprofundus ferrinatatus]
MPLYGNFFLKRGEYIASDVVRTMRRTYAITPWALLPAGFYLNVGERNLEKRGVSLGVVWRGVGSVGLLIAQKGKRGVY